MFADNLMELRKYHSLSQEELAEKIGVSRQTLSKYETGESLPDIEKCKALADVFGITVDDLICYEKSTGMGLGIPPKGKHIFGMVKVGEKGQIVIPAKARKIFHKFLLRIVYTVNIHFRSIFQHHETFHIVF